MKLTTVPGLKGRFIQLKAKPWELMSTDAPALPEPFAHRRRQTMNGTGRAGDGRRQNSLGFALRFVKEPFRLADVQRGEVYPERFAFAQWWASRRHPTHSYAARRRDHPAMAASATAAGVSSAKHDRCPHCLR